jgi:integrase
MQVRKVNIIKTEEDTYLSLFTQKTKTEIRVPLPPYALDIVHKYWTKAGTYVLPRLSSTNLNLQVKKLIKAAGWTYTLIKYRSYNGKMVEEKTPGGQSWPFYQHITAHTMRRTAITTLLILGVPENVVRQISGHAPGSREFYKYVAIAQQYLDTEVKKAHQKLINTLQC